MDAVEREEEKPEVEVIEAPQGAGWLAPRQSIRQKHLLGAASSTPISSSSSVPIRRTVTNRVKRIVDSVLPANSQDEVQFVRTVRPKQTTSRGAAKSSISERIFGPYRQYNSRLGAQIGKRSMDGYNLRKFLEDKITYKKMLDAQMSGHLPLFSFPEIKAKTPPRKRLDMLDLEMELNSLRVNRSREAAPSTVSSRTAEKISDDVIIVEEKRSVSIPIIRVNSLQDFLKLNPSYKSATDVKLMISDHDVNYAEKKRLASLEEAKLAALQEQNEKNSSNALEERMREYMKITEVPVLVIDDDEEEEEEYVLPDLTAEDELMIKNALRSGPSDEILSDKFNFQITRKDMSVFKGLNWLNDEVINFYMALLMERGKQESMPNVYAFNTFFYQNIEKGRYSSLRRWTKKIDLFTYDMVFVPVHLGMHWCMSVIDFGKKEVRYYDSMGSANNECLKGLLEYLKAESLDKKKVEYDVSDWEMINVKDIPQQMNGSDCGVFSCIFAEHLARNAPFKFSQDDMPYFRKKMVLEILKGELIT